MKVKEESEKIGLKLNIQKTKIMASGPIISWEIDDETVEAESDSTEVTYQQKQQVGHNFSYKEQASFNFMAVVTICSDCGAPRNKVCHCFHGLPICLPWNDGTRCHDLSFLNVEF